MEELTYETAYAELETIYSAINNDRVSVDELAMKVKRAAELVDFCQKKLSATEDQLNKIVSELSSDKIE